MKRDVVDLLQADHLVAKQKLAAFPVGPGTVGRDDAFRALVELLVAHEVAEEIVVYPAVRECVPDGGRIADARISEQSEAEELLKEMEDRGVDDAAFDGLLARLRDAVLAHAEREEQTAFEPLRTHSSADQRAEWGEKYEKAKGAAPTHPHPHAPDGPPGNKILGPIAAMVDKARDAAHRAVA